MKKAFSIVELVSAIAVIGILSSITFSKYTGIKDDAKVAQVQGNLSSLRTSLGMFQSENGRFPKYRTDILSNGNLSKLFHKYYTKEKMPTTPHFEDIPSTNQVVDKKDDLGGWVYDETTGEIEANLDSSLISEDEENQEDGEDTTIPLIPLVPSTPVSIGLSGRDLDILDTEPNDYLTLGYGDDGVKFEDNKLYISPIRENKISFDSKVSEVKITSAYEFDDNSWILESKNEDSYTYKKNFPQKTSSISIPKSSFFGDWFFGGDNYISNLEYTY